MRRSCAEHLVAVGRLQPRSERRGADHVVAVSGELDLATAHDVEEALKAAEAGDADRVMLGLSGLDFIDSTGIRLVILAYARSRTNGCRLRLRRGPRQVQRLCKPRQRHPEIALASQLAALDRQSMVILGDPTVALAVRRE